MPASKVKTILKYSVSLAVGLLLLWYVFKDQDLNETWLTIKNTNLWWLTLSFCIATFSHLIRAVRWNLLMQPVGYKPSAGNSFMAVMVGYMANVILPRMGEVSRCAVLNKTDRIPLNKSFGTVVTERLFDVLVLFVIIIAGLIIEFDRLSGFVIENFEEKFKEVSGPGTFFYIAAGIFLFFILVAFFIYRGYQDRIHNSAVFGRIRDFLSGLWEGVNSIRYVKNKGWFLFLTLAIWGCYFLMSYVMFFALPSTESLGLSAGFAVLVLGGLGMAAPVQGGIGAYHFMISRGLVAYGLTESAGLNYATLVHGSHMIVYIVIGLICTGVVMIKGRKNSDVSIIPTSEPKVVNEGS